jgi:hypothetical protein
MRGIGLRGRFSKQVFPDILPDICVEGVVTTSQTRAIQTYRSRLKERGLSRFEVLGRDGDRELIRALARLLADDGPDARRLRAALAHAASGTGPATGGIIVAALRRSPLVGADLDLSRERNEGRDIDR